MTNRFHRALHNTSRLITGKRKIQRHQHPSDRKHRINKSPARARFQSTIKIQILTMVGVVAEMCRVEEGRGECKSVPRLWVWWTRCRRVSVTSEQCFFFSSSFLSKLVITMIIITTTYSRYYSFYSYLPLYNILGHGREAKQMYEEWWSAKQ